jgi:hypothetical protein
MKYPAVVVVVAALLLLARGASADAGGPYWVHQLIQDGQDVVIELEYWDKYGDPPFEHELVRYPANESETGPDFDAAVHVDTLTLTPDDATAIDGPSCEGEIPPPCDWCIDCDGDGEPECPEEAFCLMYYSFTVVDECVPPERWYYYTGVDEYDWIDVENSGDECLGEQPGPAGGTSSGCSSIPAAHRFGDNRTLLWLVVASCIVWLG